MVRFFAFLFSFFKQMRFAGHRFTLLSFCFAGLGMLYAFFLLVYYRPDRGLYHLAGEHLSVLALYSCPAVFLAGIRMSYARGFAHQLIRVGFKLLLLTAMVFLLYRGILFCRVLQPYLTQAYAPMLAKVFGKTVGVSLLISAGLPAIHYLLSWFSDYRFSHRKKNALGGSAQWAGAGTYRDKSLKTKSRNGGRTSQMVLGANRYLDDPFVRTIASDEQAHSLLVGTTGAGKNTTFIAPNLVLYSGSVIAIDPKAENAIQSIQRRSQHTGAFQGKCVVIDPSEVAKSRGYELAQGYYNMLSEIDVNAPGAPRLINAIAEACVPHDPNGKPHFTEVPRNIIAGTLAYMLAKYPKEECSLPRLLDMLYGKREIDDQSILDPDIFDDMLLDMLTVDVCGGMAQRAARDLLMIGKEELGSHLSTLSRSLAWMGTPQMRAHLTQPSTFRFSEIGIDAFATTVYVVYPLGEEASHSRWLRCFFNLGIALMRNRSVKPKVPIWMLLDEFAVLGRMEAFEQGVATLRDAKIKITVVVQNIGQLQSAFSKNWEVFAANSSKIIMGVNDISTAEWVSGMLGRGMVRGQARELLSPAEVLTHLSKESNRMIYFPSSASGGRLNLPMMLERLSHIHYTMAFRSYKGMSVYFPATTLAGSYWRRKFSFFLFTSSASAKRASKRTTKGVSESTMQGVSKSVSERSVSAD